jgi:hypothetical protein
MARVIYAPSLEIGRFLSQVPQSEFDWRLPFLRRADIVHLLESCLERAVGSEARRFSRLFHRLLHGRDVQNNDRLLALRIRGAGSLPFRNRNRVGIRPTSEPAASKTTK